MWRNQPNHEPDRGHTESVNFTKWEVGTESTKQITIKNVSFKTLRLTYTLPAHGKIFQVPLPQPILLSAGNSFSIPVTFRPIRKDPCDDVIDIVTAEGVHHPVPIRASLPKPRCAFPDKVDFGLVAVGSSCKRKVTMKNASDVSTVWRLECPAPFVAEPPFGELEAFGSCDIAVEFFPKLNKIYESVLKVKCDSGEVIIYEIPFEGVGRLPQLLFQPSAGSVSGDPATMPILTFPDTNVTNTSTMKFSLVNPTMVPATFTVNHVHAQAITSTSFELSLEKGIVQPKKSIELTATYQPQKPNESTTEFFEILVGSGSGNVLRVECRGNCLGPKVRLSFELMCLSVCLRTGVWFLDDTYIQDHELYTGDDIDKQPTFQSHILR